MNTDKIPDISPEKFRFVNKGEKIHDQKFKTEPVGYFKDAFRRFRKNKSSVFGGIIILILILFAIIVPFISGYKLSERDSYYAYVLPKCSLLSGTGFWDGTKTVTVNQATYDMYEATGSIVKVVEEIQQGKSKRSGKSYKIVIDTYANVGYANLTITKSQYEAALAYQEEKGIQIFYPLIDTDQIKTIGSENNANMWFLANEKGVAERDSDGNLQDIYLKDDDGSIVYERFRNNDTQVYVRVLYSNWYQFVNNKQACFLFGADANGYDILTRLACGARLSLLLALVVSAIDLILGTIIGALEGYYGGTLDLVIERIKDFLWEIPTLVIFSLFQLYLADKLGTIISLLFAFVFFDWIATSSTVRAQMYRFKGQEYVLAARTLGAKDRRLIFRHILPNGIGYIITSSVLSIPAVILSEATLSFLGIVNLQSDTMTSIGTMLSNGQGTISTYPHCVFFPAVFIAILLICFNLFGNGLRDAFNPALRGAQN